MDLEEFSIICREHRDGMKHDILEVKELIKGYHGETRDKFHSLEKTLYGTNGRVGWDTRLDRAENTLSALKRAGWIVFGSLMGIVAWLIRGALL